MVGNPKQTAEAANASLTMSPLTVAGPTSRSSWPHFSAGVTIFTFELSTQARYGRVCWGDASPVAVSAQRCQAVAWQNFAGEQHVNNNSVLPRRPSPALCHERAASSTATKESETGGEVRGGIEIHVYAPALNISQFKFKQGIVNSKQWYVQCNIALYNIMTTQYHTIPIKMRRGLLQVPGSARRGSTDLKHRRAGAASLANPSGLCLHPTRPPRSTISYCYTTWCETKWDATFVFGVIRPCGRHWNQVGPLRAETVSYVRNCSPARAGTGWASRSTACIICQPVTVNMHTILCKMNAYRTHLLIMRACAMHCPGDWRARPPITLKTICWRGPAQSEPPGAMLYTACQLVNVNKKYTYIVYVYMYVYIYMHVCIPLLPNWLHTTCIYVLGMLV